MMSLPLPLCCLLSQDVLLLLFLSQWIPGLVLAMRDSPATMALLITSVPVNCILLCQSILVCGRPHQHMRVALVQVNLTYAIYTWQHMAMYIDIWLYTQQIGLTNFVLHCSCFGYWGLLRCSLPPQPRCCASSGWTSCQPHQEPNYTC